MSDNFYRAFEDKYRGSRELIKTRQRAYLPFIEPLVGLYGNSPAIDLGCGRGEFLELMNEVGLRASGVDLDDGMLAECRSRGLDVKTCDAIAALKECPDQSQVVVSGFHLAEHIPFDVLQELVKEALRVLKPAGLLILETPNPENIVVGTVNFYLDPTHRQPIPPQLLAFLPEYYGFDNVVILRLQEDERLMDGHPLALLEVLGGVSPDYSIVAQKSSEGVPAEFSNKAFARTYGVKLDELTTRFDQQMQSRFQDVRNETSIVRNETSIAHKEIHDLHINLQSLYAQMNEVRIISLRADAALTAIYASSSWRLTAPVRWLGHQLRLIKNNGLKSRTKALIKKVTKKIVMRADSFLESHTKLRAVGVGVIKKVGLFELLHRMTAVGQISLAEQAAELQKSALLEDQDSTEPYEYMTPKAEAVYSELVSALNNTSKKQS